jgi:lysyl-tRNA synthetase class 2
MNPIILRNKVLPVIRKYFENNQIVEALTPLTVKSAGIEPYIDPVPLGNGLFLPTSPEISLKKQFAMLSEEDQGLYEIAHAFRDDQEGNLHLREFTMVEWYKKNTFYLDLVNQVVNFLKSISTVDFLSARASSIDFNKTSTISIRELFHREFGKFPEPHWGIEAYATLAINTEHLNTAKHLINEKKDYSGLIELFTLLYDYALARYQSENKGLVFISDYPPFLRGMAKLSPDGWAMRLEAIFNGLELCSGYQEEDNPDALLKIWNQNNELRHKMNKPPHPVDYQLVEISVKMKGVSGMALGLERSLMALYGITSIKDFKTDRF